MAQKLKDDVSSFISILSPILLKNFVTFLFLGNKGIGPFMIDIGGKGIALTIVAFVFVKIFRSLNFIVDIANFKSRY